MVSRLRAVGRGDVANQLLGCCAKPIPGGEFLVVKEADGGRRHLSGLMHCGKHLCSICHPFHARERRKDLQTLIGVNWNAGQHFLFTPTARHHLGVKWRDLRNAIKTVAKKQQTQRFWKEAVLGFTRADESTWTKNGHHFHQHYLLTLREGVDHESFAAKLQAFWEKEMAKLGRTCAWVGRWWEPVQSIEELTKVFNYQNKSWEEEVQVGDPIEALRGAIHEVTGAATKKQTPWDWPPEVFAEVWSDSKGHRWFGSAGIWKPKNAPAVTEDEIEARREQVGKPLAWVEAMEWNALDFKVREDLMVGAYSRAMDREAFIAWWEERSIALGGVLGLGSPPEEGDQADPSPP